MLEGGGRGHPPSTLVSEIIRKSIHGMVSTVKKVSVKEDENVAIEIRGFKHPR
ncbi:MAG: hypothetical protein QXO32_06580 [Candidatus Bathyarchaeia archaeon]